jgi:AraC-like DNA-binding protein
MQREEAVLPVREFIRDPEGAGGRTAVSTHDRAEAAQVLRRAYPNARFELAAGDQPFVLRHSAVGDERLRTTELMLTGPARANGSFQEGAIAVGEVVSGRFTAEFPRLRIDATQPFLQPTGTARMTFDDLHLRMTTVDAEAFRRAADRYQQEGARSHLSRSAPVSPAAAAAWSWTSSVVQRSLRDPGSSGNPIVATELFDLVVRTLLTCFAEPSEEAATSVAGAPRAVRRAVAYLEEHALEAVSVPDVAAAARISVRSLQALFRRHLGVSPVEHLHAIRLDAARKDLLGGYDGDEATVRAVAERWGFGNSGRFARLYQERFGERPSETLRSHR